MSRDGGPLPPELEREIFEMAAGLHATMRYPLLFVARRVQLWIEPLLYHTLQFTQKTKYPPLNLKPPVFFAQYTRRLVMYDAHPDESQQILTLCSHATGLALGDVPVRPDFYDSLFSRDNISHLACFSGALRCPANTDAMSAALAARPLLSVLTHFEAFDRVLDATLVTFLSRLPALTHLAVNDWETGAWPARKRLLAECPRLHVLVLLDSEVSAAKAYEERVPPDIRDVRFVITWYREWAEGVLEGYSYWDAADAFVARKRRHEIEDDRFFANRADRV
ncbi:hypothetical protein MIND_01160100 [Mycena indigotica]|uniref:Uncharacterized protein n=1 Tax=Mycena indigotica TaxID=2126181 RepID=A0A8H6VSR3_9AGAR|nr:uncharacterized protein MIND_01160100 [Mycena indigotica]KAF7292622.1 hypothetical protein MIND_01160100 [Mycena indigotica]